MKKEEQYIGRITELQAKLDSAVISHNDLSKKCEKIEREISDMVR